MTIPHIASDLHRVLENATPRLASLTESQVSTPPAPGKWSAKEILGHLVDSAANNHPRFVLAQGRADLDFPGYDQEQWVALQRYRDEAWSDVLALWSAYNRHIVHIIGSIQPHELTLPRRRHSLARIAWRPVDEREPATLEYMIADYVGHMEHHLAQIYALTGA